MNSKQSTAMAAAFSRLQRKNPLNELSLRDKEALFSLLVVYGKTIDAPQSPDPWEVPQQLAREASKLAARIRKELLMGPVAMVFVEILKRPDILADHLDDFADRLATPTRMLGKPGHGAKTFSSATLIVGSEFVRLTTDRHHDEHFADLIQQVLDGPMSIDISGEAIRQKRLHLAKTYPELYGYVLGLAQTMARCADQSNS